jgi:hypothetical protein
VAFHAGELRSAEISAAATGSALRAEWESNFAETDTFVGSELDTSKEGRLRCSLHRKA